LDEALHFYRQALETLEQIGGSPYVLGVLQMNIGATFVSRGEILAARSHLNAGQDYFAQAETRDFLPELRRLFAEASLKSGDYDRARREAQSSLDLAREMSMRNEEGTALRVKGEIDLDAGQLDGAEADLTAALTILDEVGDKYEAARTALALAKLYAALNAEERKQAALTRCTAIFEELDAALDLQAAQALL
jgi:tetratricopeptide (TPR) repeat protein